MIPSPLQKKVCWSALTALSAIAIGASIAFAVYIVVWLIGFLQPVLLPLAIAGVLTYLLDPVVNFLCRRGFSRTMGTLVVFLLFFLFTTGVLISVIPTAWRQGASFVGNLPAYSQKIQELSGRTFDQFEEFQRKLRPEDKSLDAGTQMLMESAGQALDSTMAFVRQKIPDLLGAAGKLLQRSLGGFLGAFGLIIGLILVPVFLFYLLRDAPRIAEHWAEFLPVKASPFKTELVSLLLEINGYIVAFFRGQVLVGVIDGALIAIGLLLVGMDFAVLIGILVATLGIIPYAGTVLTFGPAVLIAAAQFGDWWHPLLVLIVFAIVYKLDSFVITPWIVGDSVGLHPLTVMIAVLLWTVILGGLIGALLAVPLTAALKVIARRYFWDRPASSPAGAPTASPPGAP